MSELCNSGMKAIGVIGSGHRARHVVSLLLKAAGGRIRVAALHDPDPSAVAASLALFGSDVAVCESAEAVAGRSDVDWVFIGSYNSLHAEHAVLSLGHGKDVFCEKPLATTLDDCLAVREALAQSGRTLSLGLVLRYSPLYQKIREIVTAGGIGDLISFEFNDTLDFNHGGHIFNNWRRYRRLSGTHLLEKCCHDLDLANWLVGSLPVAVASFGGRDFFIPGNEKHVERIGCNAEGKPAYSTWLGFHVEPFSPGADVIDNQVAIIEYANHVRATFHTNCNCAIKERRFYLCGSEGTLRADIVSGFIECRRIGFETKVERIDTSVMGGHGGGDEVMAKSLCATILHQAPPLATVDDGLHSCITAFAINEAMETGRVVDVNSYWRQAGIAPSLAFGGSVREHQGVPAFSGER